MRGIAPYLLALILGCCVAGMATASETASPNSALCLAGWKWWDEAVEYVRSISFTRARLVQIWLLFVILALYIIMRIKMRN